ncbi:hypothetical protein EDD99_2551 [Streptomyces sp. 846.5]|nr:ATP-binding protein [Streptomyces sp. 846.5]TDU04097.1 hypothetical protein EDD99_2551 [Streptomyces sp. 846.5]
MAPRGKAEQRVTDGTAGGAVASLEGVPGSAADTFWTEDWTAALWPETLGGSAGCPEAVTPAELELALFGQLTDPMTEEVRLPSGPASSARARRLVRSALDTWGLGGLGEVAEQLVGELVANVVRHTGGRSFGLRLVRRPGSIRFEVRDPSRALPCLIMGDAEDDAGRGLRLVDVMSDRWGADLLSRGKSVWFELRSREVAAG